MVVIIWIGNWLQNHHLPAPPFYIIDLLIDVGRAFCMALLESD